MKDTVWEATLPELPRCVGASSVSSQLILAAACCFRENEMLGDVEGDGG